MIFGVSNPDKNLTSIAGTFTPHLYTAATWKTQKSHFQQYYSYILKIIYVISKEKNCYCLTTTPEKCHHITL